MDMKVTLEFILILFLGKLLCTLAKKNSKVLSLDFCGYNRSLSYFLNVSNQFVYDLYEVNDASILGRYLMKNLRNVCANLINEEISPGRTTIPPHVLGNTSYSPKHLF